MPRKGDPIIAKACDILLKKQHLADDKTNGRKIAFLQAGLDVALLDGKERKNKYKLLREMYKRSKAKIDEEKEMMAEEKLKANSASDRNSTVESSIQSPPEINRSSSQQSESLSVTININSLKTSKKDRKGSIMQELDQSFGYFKQLTRKNQAALLAFLTETGKPIRIQRSDLSIILNGDEKVPTTVKAFDIGFCKERNLQAWAKVGAVPLTRVCLQDPSVMRILENEKEEENERMYDVTCPNFQMKVEDICLANDLKSMTIINKQAVSYLNKQGWKGDVLLREAPQISDKLKEVVKAKGKTSEQIIKDLSNSKRKHGAMFVQTGGMALNCDEAINAGAFRIIQMEKKRRLDEYKEQIKAFKRQETAKQILTKTSSGFSSSELKDLIAWKMEGKGTSKFVNKKEREVQWEKVKQKNVPLLIDPGPAPFPAALTHVPSNLNESVKLLANEKTPSQYWDMEVLPSGIVEVQDEDVLKKEVAL